MQLKTSGLLKTQMAQAGWTCLQGDDLEKLQDITTGITADIFSVCRSCGADVMLAYGNVLGAVRHGGWIPWDDDMDLFMYRKDMAKFLAAFRNEFSDRYWVHTPEETNNYGLLMTKIRKKGTVLRGVEDFETDECGAFVDIFVLENEFDNRILRIVHLGVSYALKGLVSCRRMARDAKYFMANLPEGQELTKAVKTKRRIGKLISFFSLDRWTRMAARWAKLCRNDQSVYVMTAGCSIYPLGPNWRRDMFGSGKECKFGQTKPQTFCLPDKTEEYLVMCYGDYMQLPPEDKRERHYFCEIKL